MDRRQLIILVILLVVIHETISGEISSRSPVLTNQNQLNLHSIPSKIDQSEPPEILRMGEDILLEGSVLNLDPLNYYKFMPMSLIYESLVEYDEDKAEILPTLATQFFVTNDSKHWTFNLRDDIFFHDGSRFNASAVALNMERGFLDLNNAFLNSLNTSWVNPSVEIVSEFEVKVHFSEPFAPFQNLLPYLKIASLNSFNGTDFVSPIGTGPYYVNLDESTSSFLQFYRFNQYHEGLAPFKEIHYYFYEAFSAEYIEAINQHELDFVGFGSYIDTVNDPSWKKIELLDSPYAYVGVFNFDRPELANKNVRKAINYAVNNVRLTQMFLEDNRKPLRSLLPEGAFGYDSTVEGYPFDLKRANSLLDQEGYVRGTDGTRFSLKLVRVPAAGFHASFIQESLEQVGIECEIVEDPSYTEMLETGEFDIGIMPYVLTDPYITQQMMHTEGERNYGGYSNPLMDTLIIEGQTTPVHQEREFYYQKVLQLAQEECPFLLIQKEIFTFYQSSDSASYYTFDSNLRFQFDYTHPQNNATINFKISDFRVFPSKTVSNVLMQTESLYFPYIDAIITNEDNNPLMVNSVQMDRKLETFLPQYAGQGKFYQIKVADQERTYSFRSYYDPEEIGNRKGETLVLYKYDNIEGTWIELETVNLNSSLRFIEVQLQGGENLLRLGDFVKELSFNFFPVVLGISLVMILSISFTIVRNQKVTKYIRKGDKDQ